MSFLKETKDALLTKGADYLGDNIRTAIEDIADKIAGMPPKGGEVTFQYQQPIADTVVSYPSDLGSDDYTGWIQFGLEGIINTTSQTTVRKVPKPTSSNAFTDEINSKLKTVVEGTREEKEKVKQKETVSISKINLPIPSSGVGATYTNNFGEEEMGILASMDDLSFKSVVGAAGSIGQKVGVKGADAITGTKLGAAYLKRQRKAMNPHVTALYSGVSLRQFNFEFDFSPRSESELKMALAIVQAFKLASLPTLLDGGHLYQYPRRFSFKYMTNEGMMESMYWSEGMWCTSVSTDMTPNSVWNAFKNGQPTQFKLTLAFIEDKTLNRNDIARGM